MFALHTKQGMLVVELNVHTFLLKVRQQYQIYYIQAWYACYNQYSCQNTFGVIDCNTYKAIQVFQSSYLYLLYKTSELQPHYQLTLDLKFIWYQYSQNYNTHNIGVQFHRYKYNPQDFEFIVYLDNKIEHQQRYSNNNYAATCYNDFYLIFPISITIQHSISSITVAMFSQILFWGITEFQLQINECSLGCGSCNSSGCFNQELFLQLFYLKEFSSITFEEGWQNGDTNVKKCLGFNYIVSSGTELFLEYLSQIYIMPQAFNQNYQFLTLNQLKFIFISMRVQPLLTIEVNQSKCIILTTQNIYKQLQIAKMFFIIKLNDQICDYISMEEINVFQYQHQSQRLKIHIIVEDNRQNSNTPTYIGMSFDDGCMDQNIVPFDGCFSNNFDCIQGCKNCIKGICFDCLIGWEFLNECDDGNLVGYDGCYECKYSCPKNCRKCQFGKCLECDIQHVLLEGQCQSISNDVDKTYYMKENRECFYFFIDQGYYWFQDFHIFINEFNLILQQNIKQFENQLDHYNQIFLCHFYLNLMSFRVNGYQYTQQINNCNVKQFGKCLECEEQYELDFYKQQCIPKFQDGILLSQEVCDDGNKIQFDGCYKCQQSCQIECLQCSGDKCYMCKEGWQLRDFQCKQICGDGLLAIISNEQCDDPEDSNCSYCKYQCDLYCLVCDKFQNCEQCLFPFEMKDGKCLPICGDNIITTLFEQCDDGNKIPYDGCFECQYQCSFGCIKCEKDNHCVQCEDNYYILDTQTFRCYELKQNNNSEPKQELNNNDLFIVQCYQNQAFINNQCVNLCGNGILNTHFELCDDGNNHGGDGCSALCFEEDSFKCINQENSLSICTFIQKPNFNLILLSDKTKQTKILQLSFSQEVYIL